MYRIYSTTRCPYCKSAKNYLDVRNLSYEEIIIDSQEVMDQLSEELGYTPLTVPQIFHGAVHIGGYDDLRATLK